MLARAERAGEKPRYWSAEEIYDSNLSSIAHDARRAAFGQCEADVVE